MRIDKACDILVNDRIWDKDPSLIPDGTVFLIVCPRGTRACLKWKGVIVCEDD